MRITLDGAAGEVTGSSYRTVDEDQRVIVDRAKNGFNHDENGLEVYFMCVIPSNVILPRLRREVRRLLNWPERPHPAHLAVKGPFDPDISIALRPDISFVVQQSLSFCL